MIYLTSSQILKAVKRSLENNIVPEVQTDYARVQLSSAILAIQEVISRFEDGDPCLKENGQIERSMVGLAEDVKDKFPMLSNRLKECLLEANSLSDPREKNRFLKEGLWGLLKSANGEEAKCILQCIHEYMKGTIVEEQKWLNPEAIASLH